MSRLEILGQESHNAQDLSVPKATAKRSAPLEAKTRLDHKCTWINFLRTLDKTGLESRFVAKLYKKAHAIQPMKGSHTSLGRCGDTCPFIRFIPLAVLRTASGIEVRLKPKTVPFGRNHRNGHGRP